MNKINPLTSQKIVLIGDSTVGKTSILEQLRFKSFKPTTEPTIGVDFESVPIVLNNGELVRLKIWDTAGLEKFQTLVPTYIKDATVAIIVYDITQKQTYDNIEKWYELVMSVRQEECSIVIVGNKTDMESNRVVSLLEGKEKSSKLNTLFFEVSAKSGESVKKLFDEIINGIYPTFNKKEETDGAIKLKTSKKKNCRC